MPGMRVLFYVKARLFLCSNVGDGALPGWTMWDVYAQKPDGGIRLGNVEILLACPVKSRMV